MCSCSQPAHMKAVASSKWAWLQSCCTCRVVTSSITCYHMHSLCHSVHLCHNQLQWDSCTVLESLYISPLSLVTTQWQHLLYLPLTVGFKPVVMIVLSMRSYLLIAMCVWYLSATHLLLCVPGRVLL